ncbi:hypothetical protein MUK72_13760 [Halococcus dombrowskii]|uniref:DUF1490 domain-containing protein n=1 Tax=Halococcus dombrowskii TaxID=179637 RepID=A0AAV3SEL9_HALDO|nr:hypothetical protein [Halococcus dombrowskii]UOO95021.1 hypothetical protein MUK72_13760 [Halococcus dombrowskii]
MIGLALGKKAVKHGYKRAGIPGAIATGGAAAMGYVVVKRALKSRTGEENVDSAIDTDRIKSAVDEQGIGAVTDRETLESAVDEEQLDADVDMESIQSETENEADELEGDSDDSSS